MCPLYPLHLVFTWGFLLLFLWISVGQSLAQSWGNSSEELMEVVISWAKPSPALIDVHEDSERNVTFYLEDVPPEAVGYIVNLKESSEDGLDHIGIRPDSFPLKYDSISGRVEPETVEISGKFLGFSQIRLFLSSPADQDHKELDPASSKRAQEISKPESSIAVTRQQVLDVKVHRESTTLDIVFVHVVILLVLVAYINMGCAIDLEVIKQNVRRPFAPAIGLVSQYIFMPLMSFGLGWLLFSSRPELWLGLFLTGCAPGGGGSNMWTYVLGGSLDLSITMTFISTVFAFAALPFWVYALGPFIFPDGYYGKLPYRNIGILALSILVPCCIGLAIRRCCPRAAEILKKSLKPIAVIFIVFIMTFGVYAKLYLFSFFNVNVLVAGACLPLLGYIFGGVCSVLLKRKTEEVIAISVETGIQNTGLAIGVLKIALGHFSPMEDIAIVLPVAVATFSPVPLFVALLVKSIANRCPRKADDCDIQKPVCDSNLNSNVTLLNSHLSKPDIEYA